MKIKVSKIESFLKMYGLPNPDDDQGAAFLDSLNFADAINSDFDFDSEE